MQAEEDWGDDQPSGKEDGYANEDVEERHWKQQAARGKGKERLRDVIETDRHAAGGEAEPALHETREQITGNGAGGDQGPNLPVKSHQQGGKWSRQKRENNAPKSLRRPKQRLAVRQWQTAVNRLGEPIAEPFLG